MIKKGYSIFDFVENWEGEGYGIALVKWTTGKVITPYIDPSDFPTMVVNSMSDYAKVIHPKKYKGHKLIFHSGQLEEREYLYW